MYVCLCRVQGEWRREREAHVILGGANGGGGGVNKRRRGGVVSGRY